MDRTHQGFKYFSIGEGDSTVICHPSLGMGRFLFYRLTPPLSRRYRVITYDPRGIGENEHLAPSLDAWVEDVADLIESIPGPVHLVGVSLGTWVMARVAARFPERVGKLILMGATPRFFNGRMLVDQRRAYFEEHSMREYAEAYVAETFQQLDEEYRVQIVEELSRVDSENYLTSMEAIYLTDNRSVYRQITAPTLILVGSADKRTTPHMADDVGALIPGSEVRVIPRAGHLVLIDEPDRVEELVESFLLTGELVD